MNTYTIYEAETGKIIRITTTNVGGAALCHDGESYVDGVHYGYIGVEPPEETVVRDVREQRNLLISHSDYTQLADSTISDVKKVEWAEYRQALRDLPSQYTTETNIGNVVYPTPPEA